MNFVLSLLLALFSISLANATNATVPVKHKLSQLPGPTLPAIEINPIFLGNARHQTHLLNFYEHISSASSGWWSVLEQYGITPGKLNSAGQLNVTAPKHAIDDAKDIQPMLFRLIQQGALKPNPNSYYPIHLGPEINVTWYGQRSCKHFAAYHSTLDIRALNKTTPYIAYAVILDDCGGRLRGPDLATYQASHELSEAATNPLAGIALDIFYKQGPPGLLSAAKYLAWFDLATSNPDGEVADLCEGPGLVPYDSVCLGEETFTVAKLWSNEEDACVVSTGCIQYGFGTRVLQSLGVPGWVLGIVWLAGPLGGLGIQPLVGAMSDTCTSTWGRRRPFIVGAAATVVLALFVIAVCSGGSGEVGAPIDGEKINTASTAITATVAGFYLLDFSLNALTAAARALIVDVTPPHLQADANSWAARMSALGTILGFFTGFVNLPVFFGTDQYPEASFVPASQFKILCLCCSAILLVTASITCVSVIEVPFHANMGVVLETGRLLSADGVPDIQATLIHRAWMQPFADVWNGFHKLPKNISKICLIQFWAWIAWFPFLFYASPWVASKYIPNIVAPVGQSASLYDQKASDSEDATRAGSFALLLNSIVSLATMVIIPRWIGTVCTSRSRLYIPLLLHIWAFSLVSFAFLLECTAYVKSVYGASLVIALMGVPWGIATWIPLGIISEYLSSNEPVELRCGFENDVHRQSIQSDNESQLSAGVVLGIHNVYIVIPQLISTLLTSAVFWMEQEAGPDAPLERDQDLFGLCLRLGSFSALVAAFLAYRASRNLSLDHRLNDVRILGVSFFFLFGSQSTISTLSSTVLPPWIAFRAGALLYLSFALFNVAVASRVVDTLGARAALFVSALTYLVYNAANIAALINTGHESFQAGVMIPAALLNGLGAAVIWTSQGIYVARCAGPSSLGRYSGTFFGFMWSSGVIGPLFSSSLLQMQIDKVVVFEALTAISLIALVLMAYLWLARPEPSNPAHDANEVVNREGDEAMLPPATTLSLLLNPSMILLMPLSYLIGFEQAFYGGSLPLFVRTNDPNADLAMKLYLRATLGVVITITAFTIGGFTDRYGSRPMVVVSALIHIAQKLVGTLFARNELSQAYSAYKFHTSVGTALCFFFSGYTLDASGVPDMLLWAPLFLVLAAATVVCTWVVTKPRAVYAAI
ncbi:hypothetical protein CcCBS67573_g03793 [Chytriomyces confervae]|uniref:Major facilitator superfamily (MFS) profile domain-containing protein n=1 Tax=Chytriomyces confervae TaxID=246404 RepID=A0A507FFL4_9FUNG|nr:hypothetical protein CcCBS67573_g03793 [Chytriomyces confervae]